MVQNMKINLSTKFNGSTICVFGSFDGVKVHIANIDLKVNRVYTTSDGYKYIRNCNKCNKVMMYDDDFDKHVDDNELKKRGSQLPIHKMNVMFEYHAHELPMIIRECQKTFYVE